MYCFLVFQPVLASSAVSVVSLNHSWFNPLDLEKSSGYFNKPNIVVACPTFIRWTEEIFTITEVKCTSPVTYKIADLNGEEITGTFYEPELQKTSQELFRIEKVSKRGKKKSLVKWKGYSDDF